MRRRRPRSTSAAVELALRFTQWNLGVLVMLALAFGGGLWSAKSSIAALDKKLNQTNYILALALGVLPERMPSESGQDRRAYPKARTVAAEVAAAEADSLAGGTGTYPARSGGSSTQAEGKRDVSF